MFVLGLPDIRSHAEHLKQVTAGGRWKEHIVVFMPYFYANMMFLCLCKVV